MVARKAYILGAGASGLVAGWKLLERGWDVEIIEKEPSCGGMARSWQWRDFIVDVGPHIYHTPDPQLAKFWEREFGDLFIKGDFWCKNVKGESFDEHYDYPLSYESISRYPSELKKKILFELEHLNPELKAKSRSYREYITALVGPTLQELFFEKYPKKIWGISTEEMTPDWAPKRIELRKKITPFYHGQWNAVGRYGTGSVYSQIYENIRNLGGKVRLSQAVRNLEYQDKAITRILLANDEIIELNPQDVVISTIPINTLCDFFSIPCGLTFRDVTSVYLAFKCKSILPDGVHWLYYDSPELLFHRITEPKKLTGDVSPCDKTFLTAEIACSKGDPIHKTPAGELVETVLAQVCRVGLVNQEDFFDGAVNRQSAVYPLLHKDYQHEIAHIQSLLGEFSQLYLIGTASEFKYADLQVLWLKACDLADLLTGKFSEFTQVKRKQYTATLNQEVSLDGKVVGDGHKPYIIAEAGLNHNGSLEMAFQLVDEACSAGCDAIKFQTYKSSERISSKIKKVRYAEQIIGTEETLLEMFQRLELSYEDNKRLFDYAQEK